MGTKAKDAFRTQPTVPERSSKFIRRLLHAHAEFPCIVQAAASGGLADWILNVDNCVAHRTAARLPRLPRSGNVRVRDLFERAIHALKHFLATKDFEEVVKAGAGVAAGDGEADGMHESGGFHA